MLHFFFFFFSGFPLYATHEALRKILVEAYVQKKAVPRWPWMCINTAISKPIHTAVSVLCLDILRMVGYTVAGSHLCTAISTQRLISGEVGLRCQH